MTRTYEVKRALKEKEVLSPQGALVFGIIEKNPGIERSKLVEKVDKGKGESVQGGKVIVAFQMNSLRKLGLIKETITKAEKPDKASAKKKAAKKVA